MYACTLYEIKSESNRIKSDQIDQSIDYQLIPLQFNILLTFVAHLYLPTYLSTYIIQKKEPSYSNPFHSLPFHSIPFHSIQSHNRYTHTFPPPFSRNPGYRVCNVRTYSYMCVLENGGPVCEVRDLFRCWCGVFLSFLCFFLFFCLSLSFFLVFMPRYFIIFHSTVHSFIYVLAGWVVCMPRIVRLTCLCPFFLPFILFYFIFFFGTRWSPTPAHFRFDSASVYDMI